MDREMSLKHRQILSNATDEKSKKQLVLQTDVNSLVHIIEQLESAKSAISVKKAAITSNAAT